MGLHLGAVFALDSDRSRGETAYDIAAAALPRRAAHVACHGQVPGHGEFGARRQRLLPGRINRRGVRLPRRVEVHDEGQGCIVHLDQPQCFRRRLHHRGRDRGDRLADVAEDCADCIHHEHGTHARVPCRGPDVDRAYPCVWQRRAQHGRMEQPRPRDVHGKDGSAGDLGTRIKPRDRLADDREVSIGG